MSSDVTEVRGLAALQAALDQLPAKLEANVMRGAFTPVKWRYLDTATSWAIGQARKGLKFFDSGLPMIEMGGKDPKTGDQIVRFYGYAAAAVTDWRFWVGSNFAAS